MKTCLNCESWKEQRKHCLCRSGICSLRENPIPWLYARDTCDLFKQKVKK